MADNHPLGRLRHAVDPDRVARDVHELALVLDEEVIVVRGVGVEIGLAAVDSELAQEASDDADDDEAADDEDADDEDAEDESSSDAGPDPIDWLVTFDRGRLRVELSRGQALAFATRAVELVAAGRPTCRFCGLPMDPDGHPCPRMN